MDTIIRFSKENISLGFNEGKKRESLLSFDWEELDDLISSLSIAVEILVSEKNKNLHDTSVHRIGNNVP